MKFINNYDNVLEEIISKIVNLDMKVGIFFELCVKLEDKFNFCDGKFDIIIS